MVKAATPAVETTTPLTDIPTLIHPVEIEKGFFLVFGSVAVSLAFLCFIKFVLVYTLCVKNYTFVPMTLYLQCTHLPAQPGNTSLK